MGGFIQRAKELMHPEGEPQYNKLGETPKIAPGQGYVDSFGALAQMATGYNPTQEPSAENPPTDAARLARWLAGKQNPPRGPEMAVMPTGPKRPSVAQRQLKAIATKPTSEWTAGEINKALDKLDAEHSRLAQELIDAGFGHIGIQEIMKMDHPLAHEWKEVSEAANALRIEIHSRYGPGAPSRLPTRR